MSGNVKCENCGSEHSRDDLRHGMIFDTTLSDKEAEHWNGRLTLRIREDLDVFGWDFGSNVYIIRHCPNCPSEGEIVSEELLAKFKFIDN
jgi:hypothetical protein